MFRQTSAFVSVLGANQVDDKYTHEVQDPTVMVTRMQASKETGNGKKKRERGMGS